MKRNNVVKGSDVPIQLTFKNSAGGVLDLGNSAEADAYFLLKLFYKSGEVLATYDSRQTGATGIQLPNDQANWTIGIVNIFMETNITYDAKEGDVYYQLKHRYPDSVPVDTWIDTYSEELYLFTLKRAI
jgi:hypothetical protein